MILLVKLSKNSRRRGKYFTTAEAQIDRFIRSHQFALIPAPQDSAE